VIKSCFGCVFGVRRDVGIGRAGTALRNVWGESGGVYDDRETFQSYDRAMARWTTCNHSTFQRSGLNATSSRRDSEMWVTIRVARAVANTGGVGFQLRTRPDNDFLIEARAGPSGQITVTMWPDNGQGKL
jgi:hypothetical protein